MQQRRRLASLGKFKSNLINILVATDVASRGLDIPTVDLVINFDMPTQASDYVHRVGRTARAGRVGRSISIITQFDVSLVHAIERETKKKMTEVEGVNEDDALKLLNKVSMANKLAKLRLVESGFEEKIRQKKHRNGTKRKFKDNNSDTKEERNSKSKKSKNKSNQMIQE